MNKKSGFTIIEVCVLIIFLVAVGVIFLFQKIEIGEKSRDDHRKTAINAIHYSLKNDFYKKNGYYPKNINEETLKSVYPDFFTDPFGRVLGEEGSNYRYEATDCDGEKCKNYSLRTSLEKEKDFVKTSRD